MNWSELTQQLAGDTQQRLKGLTRLEVDTGRLKSSKSTEATKVAR